MCVREVQSFSQAVPKAFSLTCCSQYSSNVVLSQCCLPNGAGCQTVNTRKCSTDGVLDRYGPENDISKCTVTTNYICPQVCEVNQVIAHTIPSSIINDDYYYTSECQANSNAPCYDLSCWQQCTECNVTEWAESPCTMLSNTVCAPCLPLLWPNTYWNPTLGVCSSSDAWVLCDACTDPEDYENGALLNTCPPPDSSKGRAPDGTCRPCVSCPPNLYYLPPADSTLTCVTKPVEQCTYTYMDQNNVPQTHLPMPFVYGWQRMPGAHNSNVQQNAGDTLPYYKACPPAPAGYVPQTSPPYAGTDWSLDCKYSVVGMCATGYYEAGGCVACPNAPQSAGGFQTFCTCPAGRATMDDLKRAFPNSMVSVVGGMLDQYCFSCTGDVSFWGQDVWTMEYIVCTSSSQIVRCSGREAVNSSGPQCETCPAGSEPTGSRNKCVACGAGAYQAGSECVACDPDTQLCDQAGMTAPLAKTSRCAEGQLLTLNAGSVNDNTCGPCPLNCPLGNTYVWAEGHNQSNPCRQTLADGSQTSYFACYPTDASQPLEVNAQFSNQDYRLVFEAAQNQVLVEPCAAAWLPPNAQWVGNGLQCVWTCKYGWDMAQGAKLREQIESIIINGTRSDLYDFWMGMRFSMGGLGMQVSTYQKVLWPLFDPVAGVQGSQWEQAYSIGSTLAAAESANYYESNTFLYVDEIGAPETLCLPPPSTPEPCPLGFFSINGGLPCAAYAQANGLYVPSWEGDSNSYYVVLDPSSKSILCSILQSALYTHAWTSYSQCGACLDQNQPITSSLLVLEWRARSSWQSLGVEQPPYGFTQAGACAGMVCMVGAYLLPEGLACIPCQASSADWASVCGAAQVFDASACGQPGSDTLADVCQGCPDAAGTLGFLTESSALLPQWESQRAKWPASSTVCKYVCAANYTSNPNATAYPDTPCLSCPSQVEGAWASGIKVCVGEGSFYFDWGAQSCGQGEGVDAYVPTCSSCEALVSNLVWAGGEALPTSNAGCLALCDPKTFFTVLVNGSKALTPVPQGLIASCEPCSQAHIVSCSNTSCVAGFYRTKCGVGALSDSVCAGCSTGLLYNSVTQAVSPVLLEQALNMSQSSASRRWIARAWMTGRNDSVMISPEGCLVACINNYVWIDTASGLFLQGNQLQGTWACVPCSSAFITATPPLYSVWNCSGGQTPADASGALKKMQSKAGACFACPANTDTIASSDSMCEAIPGYGQPVGTPVTVSVSLGSLVAGLPVLSAITPLVVPSTVEYFSCCGNDQPCQIFSKMEMDLDQASFGPNSFYAACSRINVSRRRLLQTEGLQACFAGQYNQERGNTICFSCPQYASTPYPFMAITSRYAHLA